MKSVDAPPEAAAAVPAGPFRIASPLYAHTPNQAAAWHRLEDHLREVAALAAAFAQPIGLYEAAFWAGWWHDAGKSSCLFQDYLKTCHNQGDAVAKRLYPERDHKMHGVLLAKQAKSIPVAMAIQGHHGGLPAWVDLKNRIKAETLTGSVDISTTPDCIPSSPADIPIPYEGPDWEMAIRFLLSCLVDADYLDTERHMDPSRQANRQPVPLSSLGSRLRQALETLPTKGVVNTLRNAYRDTITANGAKYPPGLYAMSGNTGIGKTLAGLAAAYTHAEVHNLDRIIVCLPYTSITDQTAAVYRKILGADAVVEHHSAVAEPHDSYRNRLAAENWDAPIIVTTTAQLFDSLYDRKPSKVRKLHNLARSVIIIDEAQTLPRSLLVHIVQALRWLTTHTKTTVLLSTATQPHWDILGHPGRLMQTDPLPPLQDWGYISDDPVMRRVTWHRATDVQPDSWVIDKLLDWDQGLVITNSVRDADRLFAALADDSHSYYLSTRLCMAHRRSVLCQIKVSLAEGSPCKVISTQLIEAGVDIDFPHVIRLLGPLPSIVQAAGRCNREGKLQTGHVYVVRLEQTSYPPGEYADGVQATTAAWPPTNTVDPDDDIINMSWWGHYYTDVLATDSNALHDRILKARQQFDFPEVAQWFRLISEPGQTVYVDYGPESPVDSLIGRLSRAGYLDRSEWRTLSQYGVTLHTGQINANKQNIQTLSDGKVFRWCGEYDDRRGIVLGQSGGSDIQW